MAGITNGIATGTSTRRSCLCLSTCWPRQQIVRLRGLKPSVQTGERTLMSYLVKPLHDQIMKAFRER